MRRSGVGVFGGVVSACFVLAAFAACGETYGEDEVPSENTNQDASPPSVGDSSLNEGSTPIDPTMDGAATADANADADGAAGDADAALLCQPLGADCDLKEACCSNVCSEAHECSSTCRNIGSACDPFGDECCLGLYCSSSGVATCMECIAAGADAAKVGSIPLVKSCCSGQLDAITAKCK